MIVVHEGEPVANLVAVSACGGPLTAIGPERPYHISCGTIRPVIPKIVVTPPQFS
jgi:hypothetical protein